jgi:hypothetical protein
VLKKQALLSNKGLTSLDLSGTLVGDAGAKALCEMAQRNATLQVWGRCARGLD